MSITWNISALHEEMQGYQEELHKVHGDLKAITDIATKCLNAQVNIPKSHVLNAFFKTLEEILEDKKASKENILRGIQSLITKVQSYFNKSSLKSSVPASAARSPAAPPMALPDYMGKISRMEMSLSETDQRSVDLATRIAHIGRRADEFGQTFSEYSTMATADHAKLLLELDEFQAMQDSCGLELSAYQRGQNGINAKLIALERQMKLSEMELKTETEDYARERKLVKEKREGYSLQFNQFITAVSTRATTAEVTHEKQVKELGKKFCEFTVLNWSKVVLAVPDKGGLPLAVMTSKSRAVEAWGRLFWLKVEKTAERIGLYLCCADDQPTGAPPASPSRLSPFQLDFQLMVKKRHLADRVFVSPVIRAISGKNMEWGKEECTTLEHIERMKAYSGDEDAITFGCMFWDVRNLRWPKPPDS